MGWAGPAYWAELSLEKGWVDLSPKMVGPISAHRNLSSFLE
jgi:hypothetical protein